jgi:hypothetical protein
VAKYDPLRDRLSIGPESIEMTFEEVANLVGGLPMSAYKHEGWWANDTRGGHVQAVAWLSAGARVEDVDMTRRTVRFGREQ